MVMGGLTRKVSRRMVGICISSIYYCIFIDRPHLWI